MNAYSRKEIARIKKLGMKVKGAKTVHHIFPRAYCIAKPAPLCAVFIKPWMDAEKAIKFPEYSCSDIIYAGAENVEVGDWCSLAYVVTNGKMESHAWKVESK
jgi:hypothetical protein